jgi:primosomal protein N' (replication factor Y)
MKNGLVDILVGTQIISKGHHFPFLTCVGVIDADLGMANGDLRAAERTYQLLHQVAGRAGREDRKGRAFLQTYFPNHPVIQSLIKGARDEFIDTELSIREKNKLPPYGKLASIIISDKDEEKIISFCRALKKNIPLSKDVVVLGPAPASITKVRGRLRYRFLIKANKDINIQKFLHLWVDNLKKPSSTRMSIDIDPYYFL